MLDPRIYTFLAVCRHNNFTRAAEELNLTQPAVSQHIRWLEGHYGAPLFVYRNKILSLTPQGAYLRGVLETLAHDADRVRREVSHIRQPERLHLGATRTIGDFLLPRGLPAFLEAHAGLELSVTVSNTADLLPLLDGGTLDLVLCEGYFDKTAYAHRLLREERLCVFCGADYDPGKVTCLEDLFSHPLLLREPGSGTREIFDRFLREKGYSTACFSRCGSFSSPHLILRLLRAGHGISVLYQTVNDGTLREIPLPGFSLRHEYHILWKKGSLFHDRYEALAGELARLCQ